MPVSAIDKKDSISGTGRGSTVSSKSKSGKSEKSSADLDMSSDALMVRRPTGTPETLVNERVRYGNYYRQAMVCEGLSWITGAAAVGKKK